LNSTTRIVAVDVVAAVGILGTGFPFGFFAFVIAWFLHFFISSAVWFLSSIRAT